MSKQKWEASLLRLVIQHLRVPELMYPFELGSEVAIAQRNKQTQMLLDQCFITNKAHHEGLVKMLSSMFKERGCFAQANNLAFLLDRAFDVWLRKNVFDDELLVYFSAWRCLLFRLILPAHAQNSGAESAKENDQKMLQFISLMESATDYARYWNPFPVRSKPVFLDQLRGIESFCESEEAQTSLEPIVQQWQDFLNKQVEKVGKISERLIQSEQKKNRSQYTHWLAYHYLNVIFNKRQVPSVVQRFINEFWVLVVAHKIEMTLPDNTSSKEAIVVSAYNEELDTICKNIVRVFCHKGESGFQLADQIIEDLQKVSEGIHIVNTSNFSVSSTVQATFFSMEELWQELSECLLSILQGQLPKENMHSFKLLQLPEHLSQNFGGLEHFKNDEQAISSLQIEINDWFELHEAEGVSKIRLIADVAQSQQLLFCNYLGMKAAQFSYRRFKVCLERGEIKKIQHAHSFSSIFEQAVKGLSKVAENQKKSRLLAAEKAKAEAEKLLDDRRKAEEFAKQRTQEIAQRTQQMLAKRADRERLEKENAMAQVVRSFNLGAWIAIHSGGESIRFKLVVKMLITGKYVFVDRLGIKKREFLEAELVKLLLNKEIEILSDGTEFEESLERVVSRIRISK